MKRGEPRRVGLLLGANIEPDRHIPLALTHLAALFPIEQISSVWQSPAVGSRGPDFWNAALLVCTAMTPQALKHQVLRPLELQLGRVRTANKYAPRSLDVDVVVWDWQVIDPLVWQHVHIAVPVSELYPDLRHPHNGVPLAAWAARLANEQPIHRLAEASQQMAGMLTGSQHQPVTGERAAAGHPI